MLTAIVTGIVAGLTLLGGVFLLYRRERAKLLKGISDYFSAPDAETLSPFAQTVDIIIDRGSTSLLNKFNASIRGQQSVNAKNSAKLEQAIAQDVVSSANPLLGGILNAFPQAGKILVKNPQLVEYFLGMLAKRGAGNNGQKQDIEEQINRMRIS